MEARIGRGERDLSYEVDSSRVSGNSLYESDSPTCRDEFIGYRLRDIDPNGMESTSAAFIQPRQASAASASWCDKSTYLFPLMGQ